MKTICIYHSRDLDGWMSAAIVKKWFIKNNKNHTILDDGHTTSGQNDSTIKEHNTINFLGWDYGNEIPDLKEYDSVIMCDVSFPKEKLKELSEKGILTLLDHHQTAFENMQGLTAKGMLKMNFSACELTWKYFFPSEKMPEIVRLLGRYDCFGHKGTDEEQKVLEFQYGARSMIYNYEIAYINLIKPIENTNNILGLGSAIYQYLCTEAKQTYNKAFPIKFNEPNVLNEENGSIHTVIRKFLCVNQERFNPINFGIDYHKEGYDGFACFHFEGGKWCFSLYNDNGEVDCSQIAKQFGGGGHKGAAGFIVKDLKEVFKNE